MQAKLDEPVIKGSVAVKTKAATRVPIKHKTSKSKHQNVSYLDGDSLFQEIDKTNSEQFIEFEDVSKLRMKKISQGSSMVYPGEDDESDIVETDPAI